MARRRDIKLDQYNISKTRYRELLYFCLQYPEFVAERNACYMLDGKQSPEDMSGVRGTYKLDPTARKAEKAYKLSKNIELIEQTAIEACGSLYLWVLEAVTQDISWDILNPPCGINQFYENRRKFFYLLNLKKQ